MRIPEKPVAAVVLLAALSVLALTSPRIAYAVSPDSMVGWGRGLLQFTRSIILVRVVESTFPEEKLELNPPRLVVGKVLVVKSLWGPFSPGQVLAVTTSGACAGTRESCMAYP